jgi:hypothetical protein
MEGRFSLLRFALFGFCFRGRRFVLPACLGAAVALVPGGCGESAFNGGHMRFCGEYGKPGCDVGLRVGKVLRFAGIGG